MTAKRRLPGRSTRSYRSNPAPPLLPISTNSVAGSAFAATIIASLFWSRVRACGFDGANSRMG
ncbi:hypothetical protein [Sphingomonas hankookensis]|uniref:hypothetical protein n=1 Tax=Sphingomonas hankookensis TaxID=563996 RepID=UPI003F7A5B57